MASENIPHSHYASKPFVTSSPLTEEFRPRVLGDFIGLEKPKKILSRLLSQPRTCALLFQGAPGTGKTTCALAFALELGAELHHVGSQECKLEVLQNIVSRCQRVAFNFATGKPANWHVVLVDEADVMSDAAQKYLLSKLDSTEGCPETIWIFTCNSVESLEERFLSRCLKLDFNSYGASSDIAGLLSRIWQVKANGSEAPNFRKLACGNVREALQRLELELLSAPSAGEVL
jgi:replication-associated recombination protein RarA